MSGAINCIFVFLYFRLFLVFLFQVLFIGPGGMNPSKVLLVWTEVDEIQTKNEKNMKKK